MTATAPPYASEDTRVLCRLADALDPQPDPWASDPKGWINGRLGEFVWSKQMEVLESLQEHRFTSVRSAHSTGKSHIASRAVAWWIATHPLDEVFVVTTAPSANQVKAILWRYIKAAHRNAGLEGYITDSEVPEWKVDGRLVAWGRKPADLTSPEQAATVFQGIHAKYVLVILDEAGGIPEWLWNAVNTIATTASNRVLAIGNPDDPASHFAKVNMPGSKWNQIKISAFDSPNYIGTPEYTGTPEMEACDHDCPEEVLEQLVGPTFVDTALVDWGMESPLFISKVLAEFPEVSDENLIQMIWIREAIERDLSGEAIATQGKAALDVARSGKDEAVLGHDRGGWFRILKAKAGINDTTKLILWLHEFNRSYPAADIIVDADGLGGPVHDQARKELLPTSPFYAGRRAFKPRKFVNRRSEQWFALRDLFKAGLVDIDPLDLRLQSQLGSLKFEEDSAGRISVETKKELKKRGLPSPDRADTCMMVFAPGEDWTRSYASAGGVSSRPEPKSLTEDLLTKEL